MPPPDDDKTYEDDGSHGASVPGSLRQRVGVTLLWHPDIERVGEIARLEDGPNPISRNRLLFEPCVGGSLRCLDTRMVSRSPLVIDVGLAIVSIDPGTARRVSVDGQPLAAPIRFSRDELERRMVLVDINHRVLIGLHVLPDIPAAASRHGMIGDSAAIRRLRLDIDNAARSDQSVLIRGETGSGKELVAEGIHRASGRAAGPYLAINCGQLRAERIGSTLFGHRRGAFTGATADHLGAFRQGHLGTLLLDEIGELDPESQPSLLRALDTGEILPLGESRPVRVDTRVIGATDADLPTLIGIGRFRPALYYRLHGVVIDVPPLRDRPDDIPRLLVSGLEAQLGPLGALDRLELGREAGHPWIDTALVAELLRRPWPGNVRQLMHFARALATKGARAPYIDAALLDALQPDRTSEPSLSASASQSSVIESAPARPAAPSEESAPESETGPGGPFLVGDDGLILGRRDVQALLESHGWGVNRAARASGIPKTSLGRFARTHLGIVPASGFRPGELRDMVDARGGDAAAVADGLRITLRSLRQRMRQPDGPVAEDGASPPEDDTPSDSDTAG